MGSPLVTLDSATPTDAELLSNLLELYTHDLSAAFPSVQLGPDGRFGYDKLPRYWAEPDQRFAFLIHCDGRVAGFALAARGSPVVADPDVFDVAEFFVLRQYRRSGVGRQAAFLLWNRLPGAWTVRVSTGNSGAVSFWSDVIAEFTRGSATESIRDGDPNAWQVFSFEVESPSPESPNHWPARHSQIPDAAVATNTLVVPEFVPGLELSRSFFADVVKPLVEARFPRLQYAAALLGHGSEVLGYDTEMSTDHDWGPRVDLFLREGEPASRREELDTLLRDNLPAEFRGYSTHFSDPDPLDNGTQLPLPSASGPIRHKIAIRTAAEFFRTYLGIDAAQPLEPEDWLTLPQQKLRTIASGAVFHDAIGLGAMRERLHHYPHDVWLYLLASSWNRIGQEEHLMGRAGSVGDELGAAVIAARLVRDVMRLCFLMEKVYAPYPKWFGTAFRQLACANVLAGPLLSIVTADTWQARERSLVAAYEYVASMQNSLDITKPISAEARLFFNRPFRVIALNGFADAIVAEIRDASVRRLAQRPLIGGVDQFSDSTDLVENPEFRLGLRRLYE